MRNLNAFILRMNMTPLGCPLVFSMVHRHGPRSCYLRFHAIHGRSCLNISKNTHITHMSRIMFLTGNLFQMQWGYWRGQFMQMKDSPAPLTILGLAFRHLKLRRSKIESTTKWFYFMIWATKFIVFVPHAIFLYHWVGKMRKKTIALVGDTIGDNVDRDESKFKYTY